MEREAHPEPHEQLRARLRTGSETLDLARSSPLHQMDLLPTGAGLGSSGAWGGRPQHVKDAALAAGSSFLALVLLQRVLLTDTEQQDSLTMALLLLCTLLLQLGRTWLTRDKQSSTTLQFLTAAQTNPALSARIMGNAVRILAQCWVRVDALHHFGFLFAFLLENIDALLLQPMMNALRSSSSSSGNAHSTWLLVLLGYVLVAGVDAYEYGSLLHTVLLIALALGTRLAQNRMAETTFRLASSPHFHIASLVSACAFLLPMSWLGLAWRPQRSGNEPLYTHSVDGGAFWWVACLLGAAACHLFSLYCVRNPVPHTLSRQRWLTLAVCSATGLGGSLLVSAWQDDWFRFVADAVASLVIIYAQVTQFQAVENGDYVSSNNSQDMEAYGSLATNSKTTVMHILRVLWAKEDSSRMLLFLAVNVVYMFVELAVGIWTNSLGLIGDAGHMCFDNGALIIGLVASYIGKLPADAQYTYGYGRVEVLSGFLNSILLLLISFHLMAEASSRFFDPPEVSTDNLLLTSTIGLLINIVGLIWFHDQVHSHGEGGCGHGHSHGHSHNHSHGEEDNEDDAGSSAASNSNMYGVYLHVLADTLGSVGVIISSLLIEFKGWYITDPLSSAMISLLIFGSTLPLLKDTLLQLLQRVPKDMERDIARALGEVRSIAGVQDVAQWHCWRHTGEVCVGALHLIVRSEADEQLVMRQTRDIFQKRTRMNEFLTIQVAKQQQQVWNDHGHDHDHDHAHVHDHAHAHSHLHDHDHEHDHAHEMKLDESTLNAHENTAGDDFWASHGKNSLVNRSHQSTTQLFPGHKTSPAAAAASPSDFRSMGSNQVHKSMSFATGSRTAMNSGNTFQSMALAVHESHHGPRRSPVQAHLHEHSSHQHWH